MASIFLPYHRSDYSRSLRHIKSVGYQGKTPYPVYATRQVHQGIANSSLTSRLNSSKRYIEKGVPFKLKISKSPLLMFSTIASTMLDIFSSSMSIRLR